MNPLEYMRAIASKCEPAPTLADTKTTAQRDSDKAALHAAVKVAKEAHDAAAKALEAFERDPQNHVYDTLEDAEATMREGLREIASADSEGSHNCGADRYEQRFFVGGVQYVAIATVEYNRFDKRLYYVDGFKLSIEPVPVH